ncbi:transposase [Streptomyces sp. NPDC001508]|uniref:IS110 family transposase n=1 Tax=Streptomyces sp. NPDC001508 TaxID=3154656 RepID=UPI003321F718
MFDTEDVGVFLGLDVGKSAHHGHGLTPAGKKVFDKQLPNSEPKLRAVFDKLTAKFGTVPVAISAAADGRRSHPSLKCPVATASSQPWGKPLPDAEKTQI